MIVGNNSIAIHIARVLTAGPDQQSQTHIADHVRESLRCSHIREVVVLGQRGPAQAPYSPIEFLALGSLDGVDIVVNEQDLDLDLASRVPLDRAKLAPAAVLKLALAREFTQRPRNLRPRRIVFRYSTSPVRVQGPSRTAAIVVTRGEASFGTGPQIQAQRTESIETSLLVHSVGYQAPRIPGLPFDPTRGIVPNDQGRVILATGKLLRGVYVTGWIKQGPRGTIPDIRSCTHETVGNLLADYAARRLSPPRRSRFELHRTLRAQRPALLEWAVPMGARRLEINALT
ncbi:hypothetical protein ACIHDR_23845 [Nocardia sp. NPDC052278]|uniref:hypothetical protein n=1 Tax=unclassified Nocardia TaxID=2637762 RepID=UPI0036A829FD